METDLFTIDQRITALESAYHIAEAQHDYSFAREIKAKIDWLKSIKQKCQQQS